MFKEYKLEITTENNLKITNNLDGTLNFKDGTFRPHHETDDKILYIHAVFNHSITHRILLNVYQSPLNIVYQPYPLLKYD